MITLPIPDTQGPPTEQSVSSSVERGEYISRGYAYAGGGRRITRVELSLDDGHSWHLADMCVFLSSNRDHQVLNGYTVITPRINSVV